jgi:hypothetical protein
VGKTNNNNNLGWLTALSTHKDAKGFLALVANPKANLDWPFDA